MCFLGLLSYYVLSELRPFKSVDQISAAEWILISWNISLVLEEVVQVFDSEPFGKVSVIIIELNLFPIDLSQEVGYQHSVPAYCCCHHRCRISMVAMAKNISNNGRERY